LGEADLADAARRYRRELHVHCYRMLGSFDEAEDHVQEVFLRAWRTRSSFHGHASMRTWLYRIATNACLDTLRTHSRRTVAARSGTAGSVTTMPWLQPYPDQLLDEMATEQPGPEAAVISKDTMSLTFLAAIQLLPPRQRAVLILRDVLDWPAGTTAELMDTTVASVNSALQRARATLHQRWPGGSLELQPATEPDETQRRLLERYVDAHERGDPEALIAILQDDVRLAIPTVGEWNGRSEVAEALRGDMTSPGRWRLLPIAANGQPGFACYALKAGDSAYRPFVLGVLHLEAGAIREVIAFEQPRMFAAFGLPDSIPAD
jgi:RNA polymerase sigma-70 factor (ECF subfamily)